MAMVSAKIIDVNENTYEVASHCLWSDLTLIVTFLRMSIGVCQDSYFSV